MLKTIIKSGHVRNIMNYQVWTESTSSQIGHQHHIVVINTFRLQHQCGQVKELDG